MKIPKRFKGPARTAKATAKEASEAASKTIDKLSDAAKSVGLTDDVKKIRDELELTLARARDSAALAKLQKETHQELSDALDLAIKKIRETAPVAIAKLEDVKDDVMQHLPPERRRRSKRRWLMLAFLLAPAAIAMVLVSKKKRGAAIEDSYDAGGEFAWGETSYKPSTPASNQGSNAGNSLSSFAGAGATAAETRSANGGGAGMAEPASGLRPNHAPDPASTTDAPAFEQLNALLGKDVVDLDGHDIGQIERVYYREGEDQPEWAVVSGGVLAEKKATVPLADAEIDEKVQVSYPKAMIESGVGFDAEEISIAQEMEADRHYNLRREAEPGASPDSMRADMTTLRAWPAGFKKQGKN